MLPSREAFTEKIIKMHAERQKQKEKQYQGYVSGAVNRMRTKRPTYKKRGRG